MHLQSDGVRTYCRSEERANTVNTYSLCKRLFEVWLSYADGTGRIEANDLFPGPL